MSEPDDVERLVGEIESLPPFHFCNKCGSMYHGGTSRHPDCNYAAAESDQRPKRLARIVRELLVEIGRSAVMECERMEEVLDGETDCAVYVLVPEDRVFACRPCRARALRERLCRIARGEA